MPQDAEGLVLLKHGLFTFADDARTSYERTIADVDRAERFLRRARAVAPSGGAGRLRARRERPPRRAARSRRCCAALLAEPSGERRLWRRVVLEHRASDEILTLLAGADAAATRRARTAHPRSRDPHQGAPLLLPADLPLDDPDGCAGSSASRDRVATGEVRRATSRSTAAAQARARTKLDPDPARAPRPRRRPVRVGKTRKDAAIAADIAEHTLRVKALGEALGRYEPLPDADLFDMEYWSLEQAKLGKAAEKPLAGQVALVTGAAGAIGVGICLELVAAGAHVVADRRRRRERLERRARRIAKARGAGASPAVAWT